MTRFALVAGSIAASYLNGGIAWERLSWALGLRQLGFETIVIDQLDRGRCIYPAGAEQAYENCLNVQYFEGIIDRFGLSDSAALIGDGGENLYGPTLSELRELAATADMLVNVAGNLRLEDLRGRARRSVYVDVDPGFTQLWLASGRPAPRMAGHDLYFTIGENVGTPASDLPSGGVSWLHTRQPVLLDEWPVSSQGEPERFTTLARWRGAGPHGRLENIGFEFSQKADEFIKIIDLPQRASQIFEIALTPNVPEADREALEGHGWRVTDAEKEGGDPASFRSYVQSSGGEFSVAKGAYVATRSGWFSDRTTRYLASGKPVLVQDTGFGRTIPVGEGLLVFRTLDDAVEGALRITEDYDGHCRAARRIAEDFFASDVVLGRFAERVNRSPTSATFRRSTSRAR